MAFVQGIKVIIMTEPSGMLLPSSLAVTSPKYALAEVAISSTCGLGLVGMPIAAEYVSNIR